MQISNFPKSLTLNFGYIIVSKPTQNETTDIPLQSMPVYIQKKSKKFSVLKMNLFEISTIMLQNWSALKHVIIMHVSGVQPPGDLSKNPNKAYLIL